jgi:hypothetical protein
VFGIRDSFYFLNIEPQNKACPELVSTSSTTALSKGSKESRVQGAGR